jgi:ABC-type taurine transport system substrate-binding protein
MKRMKVIAAVQVAALVLLAFTGLGCSGDKKSGTSDPSPAGTPTFTLANSIYTSWNSFFVAGNTLDDSGKLLVDSRKGFQGALEKKWGVDIVVSELDYGKTIEAYGNGQCDAVTITNIDAIQPAASRKSVVVMPNSTSFGADGMVAAQRIKDVDQLKTETVRLLEKSVSEYCQWRCLQLLGKKPGEFKFVSMDPEAIAPAMQQKQKDYDAAMLWNPLLRATLNTRKDCRVLFDSTTIPGEIIDTVVMGQDSLDKPGGKDAACCIIDIYYTICRRLADPKTRDGTLVALGGKLGGLDAAAMNDLVRQTRFFATPEQGIALFGDGVVFPWEKEVKDTALLFTNAGFDPKKAGVTDRKLKDVMPQVLEFCATHDMVKDKPAIGYGSKTDAPGARLRFDATYMKEAAARK